ncbi:MAG: hypothetical protein QXW97_00160 [Candidatus Pacearchaeota archaeon]
MENDPIKLAFQKVKQDIINLENRVNTLNNDIKNVYFEFYKVSENIDIIVSRLNDLNKEFNDFKIIIKNLHEDLKNQGLSFLSQRNISVDTSLDENYIPTNNSINQHINSTFLDNTTNNPTIPQEIKGLKSKNIDFSTGNKGVTTDKQTIKQTDIPTNILNESNSKNVDFDFNNISIENNIKEAKVMLDSLDRLKKEIRQKFKRLTSQEMLVFSTIYQQEEEDSEENTYRKIAKKLKLSESSIRDYTLRLISKGIPIKKRKINNKKVILYISPELKKIATLSTIIKLREL